MKTTNYFLAILVTGLLSYTSLTAQVIVEHFEGIGASTPGNIIDTFTSGSQEFAMIPGAGEFTISVRGDLNGSGWNPETGLVDGGFVDNTFGQGSLENGAHFTFITLDGTPIYMHSFFTRVRTRFLQEPDPYTITVTGLSGGEEVYSFVIEDGFSDVNIFTPNNGFTFIDFTAAGDQDFSTIPVSRIDIDTTGDADFMELDAFAWSPEEVLSVDGASLNENSIRVFPNPASNAITVSGITQEENYKIYNVLGAEIAQGTVSDNETISIQNFSNGLYLINFDNGNAIKFLKN